MKDHNEVTEGMSYINGNARIHIMINPPNLDITSIGAGYVAGLASGLLLWASKTVVSAEYRLFRQRMIDRRNNIRDWYNETHELAIEARGAWSAYGAETNEAAQSRLDTLSVKLSQKAANAPNEIDEEVIELTEETSQKCSNLARWYGFHDTIAVDPYHSRAKSAGKVLEKSAGELSMTIEAQ